MALRPQNSIDDLCRGLVSASDLQSFRPVKTVIYTFKTTSQSVNLPSRYATEPGSICKKKKKIK